MVNPRDCLHQNIHWEDFFKEGKVKDDGSVNNSFQRHDAYCVDCGETKGRKFAVAAQKWYYKKIEEWLISKGLARKITNSRGEEYCITSDFESFLRKKNFIEYWTKLFTGNIDSDYFTNEFGGLGGQFLFHEASMAIEDFCREFKKEKAQENPNDNDNNDQQIQKKNKIKRLKRIIKNLEQKTNRTAEEEAELTDKKSQLSQLESEQNNNTNNNSWLQPTLIIGGITIIVIGLIWLVSSKPKNNKN